MDIQKIVRELAKKDKDILKLQKCVVRYYLEKKEVNNIESSKMLASYCFSVEQDLFTKIKILMDKYVDKEKNRELNIDDLVNIYELLIPIDEKKENGMVFTPENIKIFILENLLNEKDMKYIKGLKVVDPSCGCGSFLITISLMINKRYALSYKYIYENIIYGVDISANNIFKTKILLEILALENGEVLGENINYNLVTANSLELDFKNIFKDVFEIKKGFDLVIGNPPYVRTKNVSTTVKQSMKDWYVAQVGNADLYLPFFQLGLEILSLNGKLGYISINTFLTSLNGRNLRNYLSQLRAEFTVINFKDIQVFKGVTSYTCIVFVDKEKINSTIRYNVIDEFKTFELQTFNTLTYEDVDNKRGWNLIESDILMNIRKIERFETKLEKYGIKNGIATLKNDVYIFRADREDDKFLYFKDKNNISCKVERAICKKIIKPNIVKNEQELIEKMEYIIFPYHLGGNNKYELIQEKEFKERYSEAYKYLLGYRKELAERDNGKAENSYLKWYAFGRTQGMYNEGMKVLLPYMSGQPVAVISLEEDVLLYCGYALFSNDIEELELLKKIMLSNVFWYYVKHTSKHYSGGYMSMAKNYIKDFSIPDLNIEDRRRIINSTSIKDVDDILIAIYGIETL